MFSFAHVGYNRMQALLCCWSFLAAPAVAAGFVLPPQEGKDVAQCPESQNHLRFSLRQLNL
eukprot:2515025-Amphidinium_carterae.1